MNRREGFESGHRRHWNGVGRVGMKFELKLAINRVVEGVHAMLLRTIWSTNLVMVMVCLFYRPCDRYSYILGSKRRDSDDGVSSQSEIT